MNIDANQWILAAFSLLVVGIGIYPVIRVLKRVGLSTGWAILFLFGPVGWIAGMYVLAFRKWPAVDERGR